MVTRPPSLCSESDSTLPRCSMMPVNICVIENNIVSRKRESLTPDSQKWLSHLECDGSAAQDAAMGAVDEGYYAAKAVARLSHSTLAMTEAPTFCGKRRGGRFRWRRPDRMTERAGLARVPASDRAGARTERRFLLQVWGRRRALACVRRRRRARLRSAWARTQARHSGFRASLTR